MQQPNIMNFILYDITRYRAPEEIMSDARIINDVVEGWEHNKYVYPHKFAEVKHQKQNKYRLM